MEIIFCSLSSGSSGNCYYIGNGSHGILVDAGISARSVTRFLKEMDISVGGIMGILVTHNHSDHIRGLEVLTRKYSIPVFTTGRIWKSIPDTRYNIASDCRREIFLQKQFELAGFLIEVFPVDHDAPETIGLHICAGRKKITIATDLGHICSISGSYLKKANLLVLESNYDEDMLLKGSYPYYLKKRILSDYGHLGNKQTSEFLADILNDDISHICLAHLSRNNNTPDKALDTLHRTLFDKGIALNGNTAVKVLNRYVPTEIIRI